MWRLAIVFAVICLAVAAGVLLMDSSGWRYDGPRPGWDAKAANAIVGDRVIIGLTYLDEAGDVERRVQFHGRIVAADEREGFKVALEGERAGETYSLPPDLTRIEKAPPGSYRLRSTGEEIVDPDFLSNWTVTRPN